MPARVHPELPAYRTVAHQECDGVRNFSRVNQAPELRKWENPGGDKLVAQCPDHRRICIARVYDRAAHAVENRFCRQSGLSAIQPGFGGSIRYLPTVSRR